MSAPSTRTGFETQQACKAAFVALIGDYRQKLRALYATDRPLAAQREARLEIEISHSGADRQWQRPGDRPGG